MKKNKKLGNFEIDKIYLMDALKGLESLPDCCIDAIVTDPPYFIENLKENLKSQSLRKLSKNNIFHAEWDSSFETLDGFKAFTQAFLAQFKRVLKDKGQIYMFFSYHHLDWIISLIKEMDFRYYKPLIWYKPDTMGVFPNQYGCNYELMLWFRKKGEEGEVKFNIGNCQRDVITQNSTLQKYRKECGFHPTPKPKQVISRLIKNCSNEGDIILDPFMGSGTTAICCKNHNRRFIGFENNPEYIKICETRLKQESLFNPSNLDAFIQNGNNGKKEADGSPDDRESENQCD